MTLVLLACWALLGAAPAPSPAPAPARPKPGLSPLAVLLSAEVDDLTRDLGHQREIATSSRQRVATAQRLAGRGAASQDEIEQEVADTRFQEARVVEMTAVRDLKAYQRDVLTGAVTSDAAKEYALVLGVLTSQEATAQVEVDFRLFRRRQAQVLHRRNAISRELRETAELETDTALASVALLRVRQAWVALEFARRPGARHPDAADLVRRELVYLRERVELDRVSAAVAHDRANLARDRAKAKGASPHEVETLNKAAAEADAVLAADDKRFAELESTAPKTPPIPREDDRPPAPDRKPE